MSVLLSYGIKVTAGRNTITLYFACRNRNIGTYQLNTPPTGRSKRVFFLPGLLPHLELHPEAFLAPRRGMAGSSSGPEHNVFIKNF